jgi:hypothetical protein
MDFFIEIKNKKQKWIYSSGVNIAVFKTSVLDQETKLCVRNQIDGV